MSKIILLNKPFNVQCKFTDEQNRPTLADFCSVKDVYAAGRLDADSEGLLVLTDMGWLQNLISHPAYKLPKTYLVQVEGDITPEAVHRLKSGVLLKDGITLPAEAEKIPEPEDLWERTPPVRFRAQIPTSWISLTIREGRNRQVRRMTAAVGFPTLRLIRVKIGPWDLKGIANGSWAEAVPFKSRSEAEQLFAKWSSGDQSRQIESRQKGQSGQRNRNGSRRRV